MKKTYKNHVKIIFHVLQQHLWFLALNFGFLIDNVNAKNVMLTF